MGAAAAGLVVFAAGAVVSILFALEARRQANEAQLSAEAADRAKTKAEEKEGEATRALEEVEATLIDGLLRPIGRQRAIAWLDPSETEVLNKLAALPSDYLRVRFLAAGLRTPESAARFARRADWVVQAAVGLDPGRRQKAAEMLMRRLQDGQTPTEVALKCVQLGDALHAPDPAFWVLSFNILAGDKARASDPGTLWELWQGLATVAQHLDGAQAGKVAEAVLTAMAKTTDPAALTRLSQHLGSVLGRLNADEAAAKAGRAAETLLALMAKTTDPVALAGLSQGLRGVAGRLDAAQAGQATAALLAAMAKTTDLLALRDLLSGLGAVLGRLDADAAAAPAEMAADVLLAAMAKTTRKGNFYYVWTGLAAVAERLGPRQAGKAADALLAAIDKNSDERDLDRDLDYILRGLAAVTGRLDAVEAGKVFDSLLAVLAKTTDRRARSSLLEGLGEVARRLDAAQAGKRADALARLVMANPTDRDALLPLLRGLEAVAGRLDARQAGQAFDAILADMAKTFHWSVVPTLPWGLEAVAGCLDAAQAGKRADRLLAELAKTTDQSSAARASLLLGLAALAGHLDATQARQAADTLLAALTTNLASLWISVRIPGVIDPHLLGLSKLGERQTTRDLIVLLQRPLAAGPAQRVLLDVLGRRTRREFRSTWHFLDWAAANGVDLAPPRVAAAKH
jgi:hypothetical protein